MSLPIFTGTDYDATIEMYAKGRQVNFSPLAYFDFDGDEAVGVWPGGYDLDSGGVTWLGLGISDLIQIEGLDEAANLDSSDMNFILSGVDPPTGPQLFNIFGTMDRSTYVGRLVGVYGQFFDEDWQTVDAPFALRCGIMGTMTADRTQDEKGNWTRTLTLPATNMFYGRGNAPASFQTDRDQQIRYPGDLFYAFMSANETVAIPVPWR